MIAEIYQLPRGRALSAYNALRADGVRAVVAADLVSTLGLLHTDKSRRILLFQTLGMDNETAQRWLEANHFLFDGSGRKTRRECSEFKLEKL